MATLPQTSPLPGGPPFGTTRSLIVDLQDRARARRLTGSQAVPVTIGPLET